MPSIDYGQDRYIAMEVEENIKNDCRTATNKNCCAPGAIVCAPVLQYLDIPVFGLVLCLRDYHVMELDYGKGFNVYNVNIL